jgi:phosphoglycolate phosphatase
MTEDRPHSDDRPLESRPFRQIGFDLDGTLVDSAPGILESYAHALQAHGLVPRVPIDQGLVGAPLASVLSTLSGLDDPDRLSELARTFRADYDDAGWRRLTPYPGARETLATLSGRGLRLFLATNKRIAPTRRILDHLGWTRLFDEIRSLDDQLPPPPDKPFLVASIVRLSGIPPAATAFVGDSADDARAARENGLTFIGATWGYGGVSAESLEEGEVGLERLRDLPGVVESPPQARRVRAEGPV